MLIFLLLVNLIKTRNYAVLINTSRQFINYRHMTNIAVLRNILLKMHFHENNIISFAPEDVIRDIKNPYNKKVYINNVESLEYDSNKINIVDLNERKIIDILKFNLRLFKNINENDNIIFYLCGHGRDGFLKINDRYFLFKDDLEDAMKIISRRVNKAIIVLDTCQAESLVPDNIPTNITVVSTSLAEEFSYSSNIVRFLGVYVIDDFIYSIYKLFEGISNIDSYRNIKILDIFKIVNKDLSSTITVSGNKDFYIKDLLRNNKKRDLKKFM